MRPSTDILIMCPECRKRSGEGHPIEVTYVGTGGWSPVWEGRVCMHLARLPRKDLATALWNAGQLSEAGLDKLNPQENTNA